MIVILFADKAIIKDTSHLPTARLLRPIVEKLGDKGCLLTGDEIAEQLGNFRVIYGVREPNVGLGGGLGVGVIGGDDDVVRHLDVIEETEGLGYRRGSMPPGRYDGLYPAKREEMEGVLSAERGSDVRRTDEDDDGGGRETESPRARQRIPQQRRMSI